MPSHKSTEHASDKKGEEDPLSLKETKSPSNDMVAFPPKIRIEEVVAIHSKSESIVASSVEDKQGSTLLPLEERARDTAEDEGEDKIPPPTLQKKP